jgi:signal transduction histidine kinase/PAS domain-containing protein
MPESPSLIPADDLVLSSAFAPRATAELATERAARRAAEATARRIQAQYAVSELLSDAQGFTEILPPLLQLLGDHLEADFVSCWCRVHGTNQLKCSGAWSRRPGEGPVIACTRRITMIRGEGIVGRVAAAGEPRWISDLPTAENLVRREAVMEEGFASALFFPIRSGTEIFGVVELFYREPRESDIMLLQTAAAIGNQIGQLVERMRARRDAAQAGARTWRLQAVTGALTRSLSLKEMAEAILTHGNEALSAEAGVVCELRDGWLEVVDTKGVHEERMKPWRRFPVSADAPLAEAVRKGEVLFFDPETIIQRYPGIAAESNVTGMHSWLMVPVSLDGKATGGIAFGFAAGRGMAPEDTGLAVALAQQYAQAAERARLQEAEIRARETATIAQQRADALIQSLGDAFIAFDRSWRVTYVNKRALDYFKDAVIPEHILGYPLWELLPGLIGTVHETRLRRVMQERNPFAYEAWDPTQRRWANVSAYPTDEGIAVYWSDVTEQRRARQHARLLAEISEILAASLNVTGDIARVADAIVPEVADCAIFYLPDGDGVLKLVALADVDSDRECLLREIGAASSLAVDALIGPQQVMNTGEPARETHPDLSWLSPDLTGEARLPSSLGFHSSVIMPLTARDHTLGTMVLLSVESERRQQDPDLDFAEEIAHRVALAMDNARLLDEAQTSRDEAERANRAKSDFLTVMSHELRTPLNAIAGYAQLLEMGVHGGVSDSQREVLLRIQRSQRMLLGLINDVLNFARIDAGHMQLELSDVPVEALLIGLETLVAPQIHSKALRYTCTVPGKGLLARCDAEKLRQVLLNLLSNAIKFTESGGSIRVVCEESEGTVRIAVSDTGRGIPRDRLNDIFDPFVQLDRSLTSGHEGTGLGLAISRDLARKMNGELEVQSEVGKGSTFTVRLQLAEVNVAPAVPD